MIYIITHKIIQNSPSYPSGYQVLHVGKNANCKEEYLRDDSGINISEKNSSYCELTGLYWIWKNGKESEDDVVGLVHYRRFFTTKKSGRKYAYFGELPAPLDMDQIKRAVTGDNTVILPDKSKSDYSLETAYAINHDIEDLRILKSIFEEKYPEYLKDFDRVFCGKDFYGYNMMICKKRLFDCYCEWLFPLMEVIETAIDSEQKTDSYQRRIYGFLSERLLQIWVIHNSYQIKTFPVYNTEKRTDIGAVKFLKKVKADRLKLRRIVRDNILNTDNKKFHI